jgi:DNA-binding beta-propeller fold protein YncE
VLLTGVFAAGVLMISATAGAAPLAAGNVHVVKDVNLGGSPAGVAVDPATNRVYVADEANETLDVLNATSGKLLTRIHVGLFPSLVAVDPTRDHVFVVDYTDARRSPVVEINGRTNKVIGSVLVGAYPTAMDIDPATGGLLVTAYYDFDGTVYLIKTKGRTLKLVRSFGVPDLSNGLEPDDVAVDTQTHTFYVVNARSSGEVWKINASTFGASTYTVGDDPFDPLAIGNTLWLETYNGTEDVLDQVSASDPSGPSTQVAIPQYGDQIHDSATDTTYVIAYEDVYAVRGGVSTTIYAGNSHLTAVTFDARDGDVFVVNVGEERPNMSWAGNVAVIRGLAVTQTVSTGNYSDYAALNPDTGKVYVVNSDGATMSILQAPVG